MSENGSEGNSGDPKEAARLRNRALKLLAGREHSQKELLQKLSRTPRAPYVSPAKRARTGGVRAKAGTRAHTRTERAAETASFENGFDVGELGNVVAPDGFTLRSSDDAQSERFLQSTNVAEAAELPAKATPAELKARAAALLETLKNAGYQSDDRYAASITRHFAGKLSRSAIAGKLKAAGIDSEAITQSLDEQLTDENADDLTLATKLWQNKFHALPKDQKEKTKHVRFLQTRGISISIALKVLKAAGEGVAEEE